MEDQTGERLKLFGVALFSTLLMVIGGIGALGGYTHSMDYRMAFGILLSIGSVGFIISGIWLAAIAMRNHATTGKVFIVSSKSYIE
jgi:hypothetical protein